MPHFMSGDELMDNPKIRALMRCADPLDLSSLAALGLWVAAGTISQKTGSDGVVALLELREAMPHHDERVIRYAAARLVEARLWHARGHDCEHCPQPPEGAWVFHDWFQMRYDTGAQTRLKRAKRRELKDKGIREAVWLRDREAPPGRDGDTIARCRYCRKQVHRKKRSEWQFDHVDPSRTIGASNIVVCCTACNKRKLDRLPSEAGMELLPPPRPSEAGAEGSSAPTRGGARDARFESLGSSHGAVPSAEPPLGSSHGAVPSAEPPQARSRSPHRPGDDAGSPLPPAETGAAAERQVCGNFAAATLVSTRTRARQGLGQGQGQGTGHGMGAGPGDGPGHGSGAGPGPGVGEAVPPPTQGRKRRRRRGRSKKPAQAASPRLSMTLPPDTVMPGPPPTGPAPAPPVGLAGSAPAPHVEGRFGSPWYGWHGRPPADDEAVCPEHGEHVPCGFCSGEEFYSTFD